MFGQCELGQRQVGLKNSKKAHVAEGQSARLDKNLNPLGPSTVLEVMVFMQRASKVIRKF